MPPKRKREVDGEATEGSVRVNESARSRATNHPPSPGESPSLYKRRARGENIILGLTGSVASIKAEDLISSAASIPREEVDLIPGADIPAVSGGDQGCETLLRLGYGHENWAREASAFTRTRRSGANGRKSGTRCFT